MSQLSFIHKYIHVLLGFTSLMSFSNVLSIYVLLCNVPFFKTTFANFTVPKFMLMPWIIIIIIIIIIMLTNMTTMIVKINKVTTKEIDNFNVVLKRNY